MRFFVRCTVHASCTFFEKRNSFDVSFEIFDLRIRSRYCTFTMTIDMRAFIPLVDASRTSILRRFGPIFYPIKKVYIFVIVFAQLPFFATYNLPTKRGAVCLLPFAEGMGRFCHRAVYAGQIPGFIYKSKNLSPCESSLHLVQRRCASQLCLYFILCVSYKKAYMKFNHVALREVSILMH